MCLLLIIKKKSAMPKYPIKALRRQTFNTHKFITHTPILSLWPPVTHTQRLVSDWIHVHLRQLAHVKIPCLRTNKWPEEIYFTKMVCNAPAVGFCSSSLKSPITIIVFLELCCIYNEWGGLSVWQLLSLLTAFRVNGSSTTWFRGNDGN